MSTVVDKKPNKVFETKGKQLIKRIYRIMLGQEDINVASRNKIIAGTSYIDKVMTKAIYNLNKDKTR